MAINPPSVQQWFNTANFERRAAFQLDRNIRAFQKNFRITESIKIQLRGEAEGATNTPNFSAPNTAPVNTLFGQEERRIFVGLKLIF